jgi:hypothetical protein
MAIISTITTRYGIDCNYSRISAYRQQADKLLITLECYPSKDDRTNGLSPIKHENFIVPLPEVAEINPEGMNHIKYAYQKITEKSNQPDFPYSPFISDETQQEV